jgi:WD40 repeat protein
VEVVMGALAQIMTERAMRGAASLTLGRSEERALRKAVDLAEQRVVASLDESVRGHLKSALELADPPRLRVDTGTSVLDALSAAVDALVARLAEPSGSAGSRSYLDEIGVQPRWLADTLTDALIAAIKQIALRERALAQLANQLNFDEQARRDSDRANVAPPSMAPRLPPDFVERPILGAELAGALAAAADQPQEAIPVVLTGAGGFGKTRLAVWACHQAAVRRRFPDGVLWVELGQHPSPEQLVAMLADLTARLTGEPRPTFQTVPVALDAFAAALGERRLLLVVDDAWREADVEPFLARGSRCVRLVTTRRPPVVAGHEIRVDAMSLSEAAALLRRGLPEARTSELAPLLERSGRWPLALTLLSGTLRIHRRHGISVVDAVDALIAELDQRGVGVLDELTDAGGGRTIAATLTMSLDELRGSAPDTFGRYVSLAAFGAGEPIPSRLLERLWRVSAIRVRAEFDRLFDRSLVVSADADGIRLHDVIRDELRMRFPDRVQESSQALLDACRPAGGWHLLPHHDELWPQLAGHLLQARRGAELGELLRDLRFLVARLDCGGPLAVESDLRAYRDTHPQDAYAGSLATILRQEAHLLTGHQGVADLALTLYNRLFSRPDVFAEIRHVDEALPDHGLIAAHPLPDRADPRLVRVLTGHRGGRIGGASLAWLPDGRLASIGRYDGTLRLWDRNTERESVVPLSAQVVSSARLSPDGRHLAMVRPGKVDVVVATTGAVVAERTEVRREGLTGPRAVCWGPDSATLAIARWDAAVELWRPFDGEQSHAPILLHDGMARLGERDGVGAVTWSPQAGLAGLTDRGWLLWWPEPTVREPDEPWDLELTRGEYGSLALSWRPDGDRLAVAFGDRLLVTAPTRRRVVRHREIRGLSSELAWRPDGAALAAATMDGEVTIWSEQGDHLEAEIMLAAREGPPNDVAWDSSGEHLAVATSGSSIMIWRPQAPTTEAAATSNSFTGVAWQPGGQHLALDQNGQALAVVHVDAPNTLTWTAPAGPYRLDHDVVWSPDGRHLIHYWGGPIWDAETGEAVGELPRMPKFQGSRIVIGWPTRRRLMTSNSYTGNVSLIDPVNGHEASIRIDKRRGGGYDLTASADGSRLAFSYHGRGLDVVEIPTGARTVLDDANRYDRTCFLPDATHLVSARFGVEEPGLPRQVALWDIAARKVVARTQLEDDAEFLAADPAGAYIAAVSRGLRGGKIMLFDARTLNRICQLPVNGTAHACAFDSAGERLAVVGSAGLHLFQIRRGEQ